MSNSCFIGANFSCSLKQDRLTKFTPAGSTISTGRRRIWSMSNSCCSLQQDRLLNWVSMSNSCFIGANFSCSLKQNRLTKFIPAGSTISTGRRRTSTNSTVITSSTIHRRTSQYFRFCFLTTKLSTRACVKLWICAFALWWSKSFDFHFLIRIRRALETSDTLTLCQRNCFLSFVDEIHPDSSFCPGENFLRVNMHSRNIHTVAHSSQARELLSIRLDKSS